MTQEKKQLLFKDLCARLPYGFTVHRYSDNRDITFGKNELDEFSHFLEYSEGKEFKPYLRSMLSMTEEEMCEFERLGWRVDELDNNSPWVLNTYKIFDGIDWLLSHHFDYRGLIPMGLALEATEGMYE